MARLPRIVIPDEPIHIMHRGNNRQAIFQREEDYFRFLSDLKASLKQYDCNLHAYVLMPNHFHLLLTPHSVKALSGLMQSIGRRYVGYVNEEYGRSGTLWEGRFKSSLIDSEHYLLTCYRYIEENPVRAGIVESLEDYHWSSYSHNAFGIVDELVTPHAQYNALAQIKEARLLAYKQLFKGRLHENVIKRFYDSAEKGNVVGDEQFCDRIERLIGRTPIKGHHGGDRKSESFRNQQL